MRPDRIYADSGKARGEGPVLYFMDRDMRLRDNWALVHAEELARERGSKLVVAYNYAPGFLGGGPRQRHFKLAALEELAADAAALGIRFELLVDATGEDTPRLVAELAAELEAGAVVTDFSPLRLQRKWKQETADLLTVPLIEVDAHNVVPARVASGKLEFAAHTLRPKLHRLLPGYLEEYPPLSKRPPLPVTAIDFDALRGAAGPEPGNSPLAGERAAHQALARFLSEILPRYATDRNDALSGGQSGLSPYLHYGMLSAERIALAVVEAAVTPIEELLHASRNKAKVDEKKALALRDHAGAFLEELIVRRELSDNFCLYQPAYDSVDGFPDWAKRSHETHRGDPREYVYTLEEFEEARTHDPLWNAAQREMVDTGKMHGYMRMYWAKKILEWTPSPEEAMRIAVLLNDRYELDGRDPNGYAGIAWSIGGVHDRAWFTRPVFGQIRYMARSGADKKFDTDEYIRRFSQPRML